MATLGEFLFAARGFAQAKVGAGRKAPRHGAFQRSLVRQFNTTYASKGTF
jgi:hypothetical protein